MDPSEHEDIVWLHTKFTSNQLSGHANDLSTVYERIAFAIQRLQSEKAELQTRIDQLEQDNPSADVRRLRDENSMLRARLATTTREKAEVTRERDALFRKLHGIKQLIDDPALETSTDAPISRSTTSTVRPLHDRHVPAIVQHSTSAENTSPIHTDTSEPKTDVTMLHDSFGRVIRPHPPLPSSPQGPATIISEPTQSTQPQPLSTHTTATLIESQPGTQDAAESRGGALGAPFIETRDPGSPSLPLSAPAVLRPLHIDLSGSSPMRGLNGMSRVLSLNSSPGMSEGLSGLSLQYDTSPRRVSGTADTAMIQKWRIHFAKPPSSATAVALPKPVATATLVQNLELDEDARRSIEGLSSEPADSLRLYICDPFGLAFLYDPILLESSEATYVVEWSEVTACQNSKAYITTAKEKHAELHTFIYAPRKNGWHYLGQQRWGLVDIKSIWTSLGSPAQRALATRSFQNADPSEITRRLKRGQIEQLTIELQQVSLVQPNPGESILVKKLRESGQV